MPRLQGTGIITDGAEAWLSRLARPSAFLAASDFVPFVSGNTLVIGQIVTSERRQMPSGTVVWKYRVDGYNVDGEVLGPFEVYKSDIDNGYRVLDLVLAQLKRRP